MSLHSPIDRFSTGSYEVTRPGATSYSAGIGTGSSSSFSIDRASVQPIAGAELEHLPEAQSGREIRLVLTTTPLMIRDRIAIANAAGTDEAWEVVRVESWMIRSQFHVRAYAARMVEGA